MPGIKYVLPDKTTITLMYNGITILRMKESDADERIIGKSSAEGNNALFEIASALAEGGEMYNRYMGLTPIEIPSAEVFSKLDKLNITLLRISVLRSIIEGAGKSNGAEEEEDVGLAELAEQNKKSSSDIMADLLSVGRLAGLSVKETMVLPLEILNSLAEQNSKREGVLKWLGM